jgi:hypothetical protein
MKKSRIPALLRRNSSRQSGSSNDDDVESVYRLSPGRAIVVPGAFTLALFAFALLTSVRQHPELFRAFLVAASTLGAGMAALYLSAGRSNRTLSLVIAVHKHHWIQALAQISVLLYWGWYVRFVYAFLPLILAQLLFAYAVDSLLTWLRRDQYALGFGPFPVVLSINLFLWFKPEWFHWQFAMVLVGYLAKEFIRWKKNGCSAHIFNPSSFPLALFSLALIVTSSTDVSLGSQIANTYAVPPNIYLWIFLVALPGQLLFGVTRMTMAAVVTMYLISEGYFAATGIYLFFDAHIPVPVFLGMHLLFTDPSTSPRSELGRFFFGILYAVATCGFFLMLSTAGAPAFYDKLLPLPLMNLMVRGIDSASASSLVRWFDPATLGRGLATWQRNLAYVAVWAAAFFAMRASGRIGDNHPGQFLPVWEQACADGSNRACSYALFRKFNYCRSGSGWACNEWAIQLSELGRPAQPAFQRACELGFSPGCENSGRSLREGGEWARAQPAAADLPIVLRGKRPLEARSTADLYARACQQGWLGTCKSPP